MTPNDRIPPDRGFIFAANRRRFEVDHFAQNPICDSPRTAHTSVQARQKSIGSSIGFEVFVQGVRTAPAIIPLAGAPTSLCLLPRPFFAIAGLRGVSSSSRDISPFE
jgi:hypothetical protein